MNFKEKLSPSAQRKISDILFILYAGGAALLSYSLVYALRKPFTAATFDGMELFGMDYKIATSIIQIFGYMVSKFIGIKLISELKREGRLKFILVSVFIAELSLVLFGCLPRPLNVLALFFNGLSLGCMWGVIFSFLEGRRVTDLLASLFGFKKPYHLRIWFSLDRYYLRLFVTEPDTKELIYWKGGGLPICWPLFSD